MKKTVKGEAAIGLQPETIGGHASQGVGPSSAISAALHYLIHPLTRKKIAAETRAETERPRQGPGVSGPQWTQASPEGFRCSSTTQTLVGDDNRVKAAAESHNASWVGPPR